MTDVRFDKDGSKDGSLRNALQNVGLWALSFGSLILLVSQLLHGTAVMKNPLIENLSNEIGFALLIAAILLLTTEKRSRLEFNKLMEGHIDTLNKTISKDLSQIYGTMSLANFPDGVERAAITSEIKRMSMEIYNEYINGLRTISKGFHLDDINWALESNKIFYETLYQSNCLNSEVRITHTGSIDTWLNFEKARTTLEQQHKLINDKQMRIIRIFIGSHEFADSDSDAQKYMKVMEFMKTYSIDCFYVKRNNPTDVIDMTWVPQLHLLSVWKPGVGGGVGSIEVTADDVRSDLQTVWDSLRRDAISLDHMDSERRPKSPRGQAAP
jgi:hypothetical protein